MTFGMLGRILQQAFAILRTSVGRYLTADPSLKVGLPAITVLADE